MLECLAECRLYPCVVAVMQEKQDFLANGLAAIPRTKNGVRRAESAKRRIPALVPRHRPAVFAAERRTCNWRTLRCCAAV